MTNLPEVGTTGNPWTRLARTAVSSGPAIQATRPEQICPGRPPRRVAPPVSRSTVRAGIGLRLDPSLDDAGQRLAFGDVPIAGHWAAGAHLGPYPKVFGPALRVQMLTLGRLVWMGVGGHFRGGVRRKDTARAVSSRKVFCTCAGRGGLPPNCRRPL